MKIAVNKNNKTYFICQECNFAYEDKDWAQKCQEWCHEHNSCSLDITKHAVRV